MRWALITDGIGRAVAGQLAAGGHGVLIVGSDNAKGIRPQREIRRDSDNSEVHFLPADLTLVGEAHRLADEVTSRCDRLHYLVHSAGMVRGRRVLTVEGVESNFAVNYLSRFALTNRLLPVLQAASLPGGRPASCWSAAQYERARSTTTTSAWRNGSPRSARSSSSNKPTTCSPSSWPGDCIGPQTPSPSPACNRGWSLPISGDDSHAGCDGRSRCPARWWRCHPTGSPHQSSHCWAIQLSRASAARISPTFDVSSPHVCPRPTAPRKEQGYGRSASTWSRTHNNAPRHRTS
jgi:NAD(P)-dependent dehydrogenase (short-subunit alcohol dehydrogenase family)